MSQESVNILRVHVARMLWPGARPERGMARTGFLAGHVPRHRRARQQLGDVVRPPRGGVRDDGRGADAAAVVAAHARARAGARALAQEHHVADGHDVARPPPLQRRRVHRLALQRRLLHRGRRLFARRLAPHPAAPLRRLRQRRRAVARAVAGRGGAGGGGGRGGRRVAGGRPQPRPLRGGAGLVGRRGVGRAGRLGQPRAPPLAVVAQPRQQRAGRAGGPRARRPDARPQQAQHLTLLHRRQNLKTMKNKSQPTVDAAILTNTFLRVQLLLHIVTSER